MINGKIGFNMTGIDYKRMNRRFNVEHDERKRSEWDSDMRTRLRVNQNFMFMKRKKKYDFIPRRRPPNTITKRTHIKRDDTN